MFKPYRMLIGLALVAGLSFHGQAEAQAGKGALQVRNEAFLEKTVTTADGKTSTERVPAGKVVPGQEVLYVITVSNVSSSPADRVSIDNPVPEHMRYVADSAAGERATVRVSVDGGKTWGLLSELRVAEGGGARAAQAADVTGLRWTLNESLKPGGVATFSFRARLQ